MRNLRAASKVLCLGMILPLAAFMGGMISTSREVPPLVSLADPADPTVTLRKQLSRAEVHERRAIRAWTPAKPVAAVPADPVETETVAAETVEAETAEVLELLRVLDATGDELETGPEPEPVEPVREGDALSSRMPEPGEGPRLNPASLDEAPAATESATTTFESPRLRSLPPVSPDGDEPRPLPPPIPPHAFEEPPRTLAVAPPSLDEPPQLDVPPEPAPRAEPRPVTRPSRKTARTTPLTPPKPAAARDPPELKVPADIPAFPGAIASQPRHKVDVDTLPSPPVESQRRALPRTVVVDAIVLRVALPPTVPEGIRFDALSGGGLLVRNFRPSSRVASSVHYGLVQGEPRRVLEALPAIGATVVVSQSQLQSQDGQSALLNVHRRQGSAAPETVLSVRVRPTLAQDAIRLEVRPERFLDRSATDLSGASLAPRVGSGETLILGGLLESSLDHAESALHPSGTWLVRTEWIVLFTPRLSSSP